MKENDGFTGDLISLLLKAGEIENCWDVALRCSHSNMEMVYLTLNEDRTSLIATDLGSSFSYLLGGSDQAHSLAKITDEQARTICTSFGASLVTDDPDSPPVIECRVSASRDIHSAVGAVAGAQDAIFAATSVDVSQLTN